MESFSEYKKLFDFSIQDMIDEIMLDLRNEIIELNQVEQLSEGIDSLDQKIKTISAEEQGVGNVYGYQSINERKAKGLQTDNVDLKISGTLWDTWFVKIVKDGWLVDADWSVNGEDVRNHFESKFEFAGLTPDNTEYLVLNEVFPRLEKKIKAQLKI